MVVEGVIEVRLTLGALLEVYAQLAAAQELGASDTDVVSAQSETCFAGRTMAFGLAGEAMLHYCACTATVVLVNIEAWFTGLAFLHCVALQALGDEVVTELALAAVGIIVIHAFLAVVLVLTEFAHREGITAKTFAILWIELVRNASGAGIAIEANLTAWLNTRA